MAEIIDGKKIADEILAELRQDIDLLRGAGLLPSLSVVLVGDDPASEIYVRMKTRKAAEIGIKSQTISLSAATAQQELLSLIASLNSDARVHGILVQLPLTDKIEEEAVLNAISPEKDVDGFHPLNRGRLVAGEDTFVPCTPFGVQQMLLRSGYDPAGRHVVIVGRSLIVGRPLATLLTQKRRGGNATVTVCHTGTPDLALHTRQADILIAAAGRPEIIQGNMLREGAVVIDVGVNRIPDAGSSKGYRIAGDVHFESAQKRARAISPVPGGVGPMTIAMLMVNTVKAAKKQMRQ